MGVVPLPLVAELGDGSGLARRDEDRVVAEPLAAARRSRERALEDARAVQLAVWSETHELADVAGAPVPGASDLAEQALDPVVRPARRVDSGPCAEGGEIGRASCRERV